MEAFLVGCWLSWWVNLPKVNLFLDFHEAVRRLSLISFVHAVSAMQPGDRERLQPGVPERGALLILGCHVEL